MAEAFFLKKKTRPRQLGAARPNGAPAAGPAGAPPPRRPMPPRPMPPRGALPNRIGGPVAGTAGPSRPGFAPGTSKNGDVKTEPGSGNKGQIVEIQIFSAEPGTGLRYNLMKLNSTRDVDPSKFPQPLLMNRKHPGPRQPPQFQLDENGNIVGRYVYDEQGKPVLDEEGKPVVEKKTEMDMSLVGAAPGTTNKRRGKRNTKEVFHQDVEVIKLRREEANPWVLEPKNPSVKPPIPEHWVGRMQEPGSLPSVLLINEGEGDSFTMVPLGRTYRFESQRPFKVMDSDQANKYFEMQAKYKVHDRWGQRQEDVGPGLVKVEQNMSRFTDRAARLEYNIKANKGELRDSRPVKREQFEDDLRREGRGIGRGLEGGLDEELDYDAADDFQDDEDSNTFYVDKGEEEEKKLQEERQKQEFRWANANLGTHLEDGDEDEDEDLFGSKLNSEGKRLRKVMRKRAEEDGELYDTSEDDDSSEDEETEKEKEKEKTDKEKEKDKNGVSSKPVSRAGSKAPDSRGRTGSPSRKLQPPTPERAGTQPPGSGAAFLAKRAASRGASPLPRPRASSPLVRGSSPDARGSSPAPGVSANGRESSPAGREGTPGGAGAAKPKTKAAKRKATSESPLRDTAPPAAAPKVAAGSKRKSPEDTPTPGSASARGDSPAAAAPPKKKKSRASSGSATPVPEEPDFPNAIQRDEVMAWLRAQPDPMAISMQAAIAAFMPRIRAAGENLDKNQRIFLRFIKMFTEKSPTGSGNMRIRAEYM